MPERNLVMSQTIKDLIHEATDIHSSLQEAADMMVRNHSHRVIVVDQSDLKSFPLGVISSLDIVAAMARPGSIWQRKT